MRKAYILPDKGGNPRYMHDVASLDSKGVVIGQVTMELLERQSSLITEEAICPITQQPLSSLDDSYFLSLPRQNGPVNRKCFSVGRLECGHMFSVDALARHMILNDLRCPVCRQGPYARASIRTMPPVFRKMFTDEVTPPRGFPIVLQVPSEFQTDHEIKVQFILYQKSNETKRILLGMQWVKEGKWLVMPTHLHAILKMFVKQLRCELFVFRIWDLTLAITDFDSSCIALSASLPVKKLRRKLVVKNGTPALQWR